MELLQRLEERGYPAEYLFSRIRGRRARLIRDWRPLIFDTGPFDSLVGGRYQGFLKERTASGIGRDLVKEYRWVYGQMSEQHREIFLPFFLYSELRTLYICLRHGKSKKSGTTADLLVVSLLSDEIKHVLSTMDDAASAVSDIERIFRSRSGAFAGLRAVFDAEGLRGFEQRLTNTFLATTVQERLHPLMKPFFMRLIDSRNIMGVYKYLKLELKAGPSFIKGGGVSEQRLGELVAKEDLPGVASLIREFTGVKADASDATQIEMALYKGTTGFLKKEGKDPLGAGLVLDYLWRCSIETMNLSVLFHGKELEREAITAELVQ